RGGWLRLAPGELLCASFEEFLDGPEIVAFTRGVRGNADLPFLAPDIVEIRYIAGETLVTVEAFVGDEAEVSATTVPIDRVGPVLSDPLLEEAFLLRVVFLLRLLLVSTSPIFGRHLVRAHKRGGELVGLEARERP